ncbi:MAG TPA: hypothetical protein VFE05_18945 [Longimicrobiaceae bacterium]|jgi:hypothetical protein|nr:hypothetical protein [Longimicrobiaceae bacterium]
MLGRFLTVVLIFAAACGPLRHGSAPEADSGPLRLCVRNATVGYGTLVARAGSTRFDVDPGSEVCKPLMGITQATVVLRARTNGGGSAGPLSYGTTLLPGTSSCWRWRLGNSASTQLDLLPCEEPASGTSSGDTTRHR